MSVIAANAVSALGAFGGNIEQTSFAMSGSFVTIDRKALSPETGETQHIKFKPIRVETDRLVFDPHVLPKEIDSGFLRTRDWDAYWDLPQQRWRKIPKGLTDCVGPSLDENSVIYSRYTRLSDLFGFRLESKLDRDASCNNADVSGLHTIQVDGSRPGERKIATFDVADNGMIRSVEISQAGILEKKVTNEVVQKFSFVPDFIDSSLYDQFRALTLENDGRIGLRFDPRPGELIIASVAPGSPAAAQQLSVGDRVVSVNGIPLRLHSVGEFQNLVKGSTSVLLETISPSGSVKRYKVQKKLFFTNARGSH